MNDDYFADGDEYPDPTEVAVTGAARRAGRAPKPYERSIPDCRLTSAKRLEMQKHAAIDLIRERGPLPQKQLCDTLGLRLGDAWRVFKDERFVLHGRGQPVTLNEVAIATHAEGACYFKESSILSARQNIYAELAVVSGPRTVAELVAILHYDRRLVEEALADKSRFERQGERWQAKLKPLHCAGYVRRQRRTKSA